MELRQLEYLVAVAEEANFTRAAERVHISQSGVSAQIRQLERDLGATLFDRSGRTATLTPAGAAAVEHARAVLGSVEAVRRAVDEVTGLIRGRLVVGMVTGCTIGPLFEALAAFHRAHPGVEIVLIEDNSAPLIERVRSGAIDLALVGAAGAPPPGLGALPIVTEPIVAAVPVGHHLARRRRTTLVELSAHPIVGLPAGTGIRTVFDEACAAAGIRPHVALEASAPDAVLDLAVRGFGIAVVSRSMVTAHRGGLNAVAIDGVDADAVLALVWATTTSAALRELISHCREAFTVRRPTGGAGRRPAAPARHPAR
jgi:DNA-binding transcriptional LysR family regulator